MWSWVLLTWKEVKNVQHNQVTSIHFVAGIDFTLSVLKRTGVFISTAVPKFHLRMIPSYLAYDL